MFENDRYILLRDDNNKILIYLYIYIGVYGIQHILPINIVMV